MINYITYKPNGQISGAGCCLAEDFSLQEKDGELLIEGFGVYAAGYIDNKKFVIFPPKPSEHHTFDYTTKQWIDPRTPETQWPIVRQERDQLLQASDYTQLPDVPLTDKAAWATYRQALRDVTTQTDPFNIVWPVAPQS